VEHLDGERESGRERAGEREGGRGREREGEGEIEEGRERERKGGRERERKNNQNNTEYNKLDRFLKIYDFLKSYNITCIFIENFTTR
jgi:hypothetical protein